MACRVCKSNSSKTFNGEVAIHFPGLAGLDRPIVWVFPKMSVCLQCGLTEFVVPEREMKVLSEGKPVDGVMISGRLGKNTAVTLTDDNERP